MAEYYDTQRGVWVSDTRNPGDIRTDAERAADIAAEKVRHPVPPPRGSGLNVDYDGNGIPLGRPLDAGAAAAERARLADGKPLSDEQALALERNPDGRWRDDNDALVAGNASDIIADIDADTDLDALEAAEKDREVPRKGLLAAIGKERAARKAK